jgi:uncharacterized protein (DUF1800 family)
VSELVTFATIKLTIRCWGTGVEENVMTAREPQAAALVLHRFGLGPLRNSIAAIASDPRGALLEELNRPGAGRITSALPSSAAVKPTPGLVLSA